MRRLLFALLFCLPVAGQVFSIGAPKAGVLAGETMTLTPILRDAGGNLIPATDWVWTSLNPDTLAVDSGGNVTGLQLGTGGIKLESPSKAGTLFGTLQLEVQPKNVTLTPQTATVNAGDSVTFVATAFDVNDQPLPNAGFSWDLTAEDGRPNLIRSTTSIDANGVFTSTDVGNYTVHAQLTYTLLQALPSHFEVLAHVSVVLPQYYQIDRLLTSDPVTAKRLLPAPGVFTGSESGAMAFTASADGLSTAMIAYQGGNSEAVVTTGFPSPQPGGVIAGFQSVAMNAKGEALIAIKAGDRANGALLARSGPVTQYVLLDNATGSDANGNPAANLTFMQLTPYCLNDNGTAVIKALYLPQDQTDPRDGIFLLRNALGQAVSPQLLWSAEMALPSVPLTGTPGRLQFIFDNTEPVAGWAGQKGLGIDNQENVYFIARSAQGRGLFQVRAGGTPQKIIAVGDTFLNSKVKDIQDLIVTGSGDVAIRVDLTAGDVHVTLFRLGKYFADLLIQGNPNPRLLAASAAGVLFEGVPAIGKPEALYLWNFKTATSVLGISAAATYISTATMNSKGSFVAVVRTATNNFVLTQPGVGTLLTSGSAANLTAAADLQSIVKGSRAALPSIEMSDPASLFEPDGAGNAVPKVVLGQTLSTGLLYGGADRFPEDLAGNQYFVSANTLFRYAGGVTTPLVLSGAKASDGVLLTPRRALGANGQGAVLFDCATNAVNAEIRMYKWQGGALTLVTRTKTAFGGHQIVDWSEAALDESGNAAVILALDDGSQELAEWTGATAKSIANTRYGGQLAGEQVVRFDRLRAAGSAFFARFALVADYYRATVVRFTSAGLDATVRSGDMLPDGTVLGDLRLTDANRNGDVIFTSTAQLTGTQVLGIRSADGRIRIVAANNQALPTGDYLERFSDASIRDDGTIYFLALDVNDRAMLFRAKPN